MHAMYEFGWTPHEWGAMSYDERMLVVAMIQVHGEEEKAANEKAESDAKRKSKRRT